MVQTSKDGVPFESGCLKDTVQLVREWFENADDSQF